MHYPVMTERQLAFRWKISLKTLRRWRAEDEGPTWHKFFQYVRYHEADVLDFERQSAQHWTAILGDGERVPKVVTRPPQEQIETEEDDGAFYITAQGVIEATGLPKHWFTTPEYRARKQVPHLALVGSIRFSLQAIWEWEQNHSTVGRPPSPKHPDHQIRSQSLHQYRACHDGMSSPGNWTENSSIPFSNLNKCPLFWPKVHHFGHLSLEGGPRNRTRVRNPSQIVTPWP